MRRFRLTATAVLLAVIMIVIMIGTGCGTRDGGSQAVEGQNNEDQNTEDQTGNNQREEMTTMTGGETATGRTNGSEGAAVTNAALPEELSEIPREYFRESDEPGTLVELEYDTYEAMTYDGGTRCFTSGRLCICPMDIPKRSATMCSI